MTLQETRIVTVRATLVGSLDAMDAGGTALRWARHLFPVRQTEKTGWRVVLELLDALDAEATPEPHRAKALLAVAGLRLLTSVGYALDLERCVVCHRACPPGVPAFVQASRGGIVCQSCGGGGRLLDPRARELAARVQRDGASLPSAELPTAAQAVALVGLVTDSMAAHAGLDPSK